MTNIVLEEHDRMVIVELDGEIVLSDVNFLKEKVKNYVADKKDLRLLIDMKNVEFIDSSGVGMLISWYKMTNEKEGKIVYCCVGDYVKKIMAIAKLDKIFPLADHREAAMEMLSK